MSTAAIILAAGLSSRMGQFKPLMEVGGVSALEKAVRAASDSGCMVWVVTGHERDRISPLIHRLGALEVKNDLYREGMFSSVCAGIKAASSNVSVDGALIWPCDCPLIPPSAAKLVIEAGRSGGPAVACCAGKRGHPLYIPRRMFESLLSYTGPGGMKGFLTPYRPNLTLVETDTDYVLLDMDTPESFSLLLRRAGDDGKSISDLFSGKRLWLLRHGDTVQHSGKIFMGQCDVPLSEEGRMQAVRAAEELSSRGFRPSVIYSSDLSRAAETASIVSGITGGEVQLRSSLREIDLGTWDGELISSVAEKHREEYKERGEYLASYTAEHGENFYDVRRRVKKEMKEILRSPGETLIVTHLGVIQSIRSLSEDRPLGECILLRDPPKGCFTVL